MDLRVYGSAGHSRLGKQPGSVAAECEVYIGWDMTEPSRRKFVQTNAMTPMSLQDIVRITAQSQTDRRCTAPSMRSLEWADSGRTVGAPGAGDVARREGSFSSGR